MLGIDCMTPYYDVSLKRARERILHESPRFSAANIDIADGPALADAFARYAPDVVLHFAAQAGVRYSIDHPEAYVGSNLVGSYNILEACRAHPVKHLLIASTSLGLWRQRADAVSPRWTSPTCR